MAYVDFWSMLGYTNNAQMMMEAFASSSNIFTTDNPEYTQAMFTSTFRIFKFGTERDEIPNEVFNLFKAMADKAIKHKRYRGQWEYIMGLYIAHYLTLYLQTQNGTPGAQAALQGAMPKGVAQSKSVDGLSISYDFMDLGNDLAGYGTYKLTAYGQQLATLTKIYGTGMWVNG